MKKLKARIQYKFIGILENLHYKLDLYLYDEPSYRELEDEYYRVRAENEDLQNEVEDYRDRLSQYTR